MLIIISNSGDITKSSHNDAQIDKTNKYRKMTQFEQHY